MTRTIQKTTSGEVHTITWTDGSVTKEYYDVYGRLEWYRIVR